MTNRLTTGIVIGMITTTIVFFMFYFRNETFTQFEIGFLVSSAITAVILFIIKQVKQHRRRLSNIDEQLFDDEIRLNVIEKKLKIKNNSGSRSNRFMFIIVVATIIALSCTQSQPSHSQTTGDGWILIGQKGSCQLWYKSSNMRGYYWSVCEDNVTGIATSLVVR